MLAHKHFYGFLRRIKWKKNRRHNNIATILQSTTVKFGVDAVQGNYGSISKRILRRIRIKNI